MSQCEHKNIKEAAGCKYCGAYAQERIKLEYLVKLGKDPILLEDVPAQFGNRQYRKELLAMANRALKIAKKV